jgi:acetyl-CoA carboxylase, biotin carboxylase subunit
MSSFPNLKAGIGSPGGDLPSKRLFDKILIANRGEIALRVICACKELGIPTVAVYSEADRYSLHVRFADEAVCIGPAKSALSYLDIPAVISAAEITNVEAIHPGYGFLSENADFAEVCQASGIEFIGPRPDVIRLMGLKQEARAAMQRAGVPILPGSEGIIGSLEEAVEMAASIGYPVILKASAGGGGRGMRIVREQSQLERLLSQAQQEAAGAFSNSDVYLEKYIESPRHIEFQILADHHGNVEVLGERECSIQRRHQKLVEEAPSPAMTPELRARMQGILQEAFGKIGYTNAGTVEFLMDEDGQLYFIEVNARIQVEHPVTEFVTGVDLVKAQIRIAAGEPLASILPPSISMCGHAIECRINAEHPETFVPSPGLITAFHAPGGNGVRVDTAAYASGMIPPYYDSLVAKLVTFGHDRSEAIERMRRALEMFVIEGIHTSIPLQQRILSDPDFVAGNFSTKFVDRFLADKPERKTAKV